jgi:hypothetical protein
MNQDLRVPILPTIEFRISLGRFIYPNFVAHNEGWFGTPRDDHITQVAVVGFNVALTGSYC